MFPFFPNQLIFQCEYPPSAIVSSAIEIDSAPPGGHVHTHQNMLQNQLSPILLTAPDCPYAIPTGTRTFWLRWWGDTAVKYVDLSELQTLKLLIDFWWTDGG